MVRAVLYLLPPEQYFENLVSVLIKEVKEEKVIYVTTNKSYSHLVELLKDRGLKPERFFYIDCISRQVGIFEEEPVNCVFLETPSEITQLAIALNKAVETIPGEKAVLFDSLSTLLIYNSESVVGKFSNFIINRLRVKNISTILIALETDVDKKVIKTIESFVDEVKKWYLT